MCISCIVYSASLRCRTLKAAQRLTRKGEEHSAMTSFSRRMWPCGGVQVQGCACVRRREGVCMCQGRGTPNTE